MSSKNKSVSCSVTTITHGNLALLPVSPLIRNHTHQYPNRMSIFPYYTSECYDLRLPVMSTNSAAISIDLHKRFSQTNDLLHNVLKIFNGVAEAQTLVKPTVKSIVNCNIQRLNKLYTRYKFPAFTLERFYQIIEQAKAYKHNRQVQKERDRAFCYYQGEINRDPARVVAVEAVPPLPAVW